MKYIDNKINRRKNLFKDKRGTKINNVANVLALIVVGILIILNIASDTIPTAQTAGNSMNDSNRCADVGCYYNASDQSGYTVTVDNCVTAEGSNTSCTQSAREIPLGNLFGGNGFVFILAMVAILYGMVQLVLALIKGK